MMRSVVARLAGALLAAALALPTLAHAQTNAQLAGSFSQLFGYTKSLAERVIAQEAAISALRAENEQQRLTINATIEALDQERCRISRLTGVVRGVTDARPIPPGWADGVDCRTLKPPAPPFPARLAAPATK